MKLKFYLLAISVLLPLCALGTFYYTYDSAGNLAKRSTKKSILPPFTKGNASTLSLLGDELKISAFPNPTEGPVKITVQNLGEDQSMDVFLYDMNGSLIKKLAFQSAVFDFDLSGQAAGIYLLRVVTFSGEGNIKLIRK